MLVQLSLSQISNGPPARRRDRAQGQAKPQRCQEAPRPGGDRRCVAQIHSSKPALVFCTARGNLGPDIMLLTGLSCVGSWPTRAEVGVCFVLGLAFSGTRVGVDMQALRDILISAATKGLELARASAAR